MPTVPNLPPQLLGNATASPASPLTPAADPANYLLAAADLHQSGQLSAPVPTGHPLQTGKKPGRRSKLEVVK